MKLPITNASTGELVGTLDVLDDMAEYMAACYLRDLGFTVEACVEIQDGKPVLKQVSLLAVPLSRKKIRSN